MANEIQHGNGRSPGSVPAVINKVLGRLRAVGDKLAFLGPTLARLTVGVVFIGTGWGKLHSLPDVTSFFTDLGIPFPGFNARLTAGTEFFGGLLILAGLGTRLVALPLAFTMVVAIITAKRGDITGLTALVGFEEWSYLVLFVWLALAGAGPLSVDALIGRLRRGSSDGGLPKPLLRPPAQAQPASGSSTQV